MPIDPDPNDPANQALMIAIQRRLYKDLSQNLPEEWLKNANAENRAEFLQHMATSKTMREIVEIASWTALCIAREEASRARPQE